MVVQSELIKRIRDFFNLNIYESKVWLALTGKGVASAGEISEMSGVPRSRTYDVLEGLEKQGFVVQKIGKPVKYLAVKPDVIVEKLKNLEMEKAKEKIETLSGLKNTTEYEQLESLYNETLVSVKREDLSASIKGKLNVFNHLRDVLESAEKEVVICTDARELILKSKIFSNVFERLKNRKIELKIFLRGAEEDIEFVRKKFKIELTETKISGKFFIIDKTQVFFIITNNSAEEEIGIWLNTEFFAKTMADLFDIATKKKKSKK